MSDVYEKLRERLDDMATGYPATESKIEIKILKRLFDADEAEFFLHLSPFLETPEAVAARIGESDEAVAEKMEQMAKKGLLFRQRKDGAPRYAAIPYVVGIFEFQLNALDKEFSKDNFEYFDAVFGPTMAQTKTPVLRSIPVNKELVAKWPVAPYEDVLDIIDNQRIIGIAPCICRSIANLADRGCDKTVEACFVFGSHAEYYIENGMGREITKEEAKEIVRKNDEVGLVMQPFNSQKVGGMCSCCGCCCGMLRSLKLQPKPAEAVQSNYFAEVDAEECSGCETCIDRCQMDAIDMEDEIAAVNLDRCIGCGLCVTTCPTEAIVLVKKAEDLLYVPPQNGVETYMRIAQERGKI